MREISYKCNGCGKIRSFQVSDEDKQKLKDKKSCVQCRRVSRNNKELNRRGQKKITQISGGANNG